eukprot:4981479-Amphidinium_carterae.1
MTQLWQHTVHRTQHLPPHSLLMKREHAVSSEADVSPPLVTAQYLQAMFANFIVSVFTAAKVVVMGAL